MRSTVLFLLIAVATSASAKGWSTPAGGRSTSGGPEVLFTFDDGPNPTTTPKVLDILAKHQIKAVFFMVGEMVDTQNKKVPPIIARILRDGHVIANHTMTHQDLCRVKTIEAAIADIDDGRAAIEKVAAVQMVWFRAPFGVRCDRLDGLLAERGIEHFHWDLDPQEWKHNDKTKTVNYVTGSLARSSARNVLLLHDIKPVTVAALPEILAWIDGENAKRTKANQKPIRILQAPELAIEQLPTGLVAFARDAIERLRGLRGDLASVLP
ncbi:MAG: polysaccharide deacetylase family protein [Deltaproteobacteria bacterium]|nr:polysaccharide deacetylase family protein [Deltaproteobacteria bacterium]